MTPTPVESALSADHLNALATATEAIQGNTCWDDINDTYESAVQLLQSHATMVGTLRQRDLISYVDDPVALVSEVQSLARDLHHLNAELIELHALHANKKGGSQTPDEMLLSYEVYEKYHAFMLRHDGVVMPIVAHLAEILKRAEGRLLEAKKAASDVERAQSVSDTGPIDVAVREKPAVAS